MTLPEIGFYLCAVLTAAFAVVLIWRLVASAPVEKQKARSGVPKVAGSGSLTGETAEAIVQVVDSLAAFGAKLDKLGPTAILATFTMFFGLLTLMFAGLQHIR